MEINYEIQNIIGKWELEKPFDLKKFMKFISRRDKEKKFHFIGKDKQLIEIDPLKFKIDPQKHFLQLTPNYFDVIEKAKNRTAREIAKTIESAREKDNKSKPEIIIEKQKDLDKFTIVITKCKNKEEFSLYTNEFIELLKEFGMKFELKPQFTVKNILVSGEVQLKKKLDLKTISDKFEGMRDKHMTKVLPNVQYEPKKFPGVIFTSCGYEPSFFRARFLLFNTGRFVIAKGIESELMLETAIRNFEQILLEALEALGEQAFL